jgi:hypothetical protein
MQTPGSTTGICPFPLARSLVVETSLSEGRQRSTNNALFSRHGSAAQIHEATGSDQCPKPKRKLEPEMLLESRAQLADWVT